MNQRSGVQDIYYSKEALFNSANDDQLLLFIAANGASNNSLKVQSEMPFKQRKRFRDIYCIISNKGLNPFSPDEDKNLLELVSKYGKNWRQISKYFLHKTEESVKYRWKYLTRLNYKKHDDNHHETDLSELPEFKSLIESSTDNVQFDALTYLLQSYQGKIDFVESEISKLPI
ncbi:Myb-like DNA-binding domain containing protein [Trichomonas vaginalis G3]|uniref:Myb-like DNA-binding domain containing protein n=1 Tax=Trichomonas vaginalis (strain ATCC PRA-98 / G3) TaxID=412133 RepID=A2EDE8_TRIV3|nr:homeodomain-like family [Trichomonas vaginalis G3]EAY09312.1 Myb-like DNA-binding domain containing protein [Trichomonas vaginalis G3]KAI5510869.1 homeodomain-like family [Trichomonas vaginalis G3]|eukprot:XP_001321535.1 Myb-like DNA-binding domain containing protein [Trichomonas vaginalis G3]